MGRAAATVQGFSLRVWGLEVNCMRMKQCTHDTNSGQNTLEDPSGLCDYLQK